MVSLFVSLLFPFLALVIVVFSYWFFIIRRRGPDFSNTLLRSSYDYVIVGAGNSGCVVAARLVEAGLSVLVLEAGGEDGAFNLKAPLAAYETQKTEVDWQFTTVPQKEMEGRTSHWPRGKVLGGCTNLNFMLAVRGSAAEYDDWESKHGCRGWSYKALLPYFKRLESYVARTKHSSDNDSRGAHGPLYIAEAAEPLRGASLFVEASAELGYRVNYDYNAGSPEGASLAQLTIKHGQRQSSAVAYLHPARAKHPDLLHIRTRAHVVSLNHQDRTVTFMSGSSRVVVKASREIVLCAGAVGTPHLLLSSGIGDTNHLKAVGVDPKIHLPGVGRNLQDHLFVPVAFSCDEPIGIRKVDVGVRDLWRYFTSGTGALSSQGLEAMSFLRTQPMLTCPDVQLHCVTAGGGEKKGDENKNARNMGLKVTTFPRDMPAHLLYIMPTLLRPRSKGSVRLQSNDPFAPPIIDPGYLTDERDVKTLMRGKFLGVVCFFILLIFFFFFYSNHLLTHSFTRYRGSEARRKHPSI